MATSDSDDFESADEELVADDITTRKSSNQRQWQNATSTIGSDSDDDNECMPAATTKNLTTRNSGNCSVQSSSQDRRSRSNLAGKHPSVPLEPPVTDFTAAAAAAAEKISQVIAEKPMRNRVLTKNESIYSSKEKNQRTTKNSFASHQKNSETCLGKQQSENKMNEELSEKESVPSGDARNEETIENLCVSRQKSKTCVQTESNDQTVEKSIKTESRGSKELELKAEATKKLLASTASTDREKDGFSGGSKREKAARQKKWKDAAPAPLGSKKLASKIVAGPKSPSSDSSARDEIQKKVLAQGKEPPVIEECWEFDEQETAKILKGLNKVDKVKMPEELRSEKKFKEIFKPDGWEGLDDETILSELEDNSKTRSVSAKMTQPENSGWGGWGSWGVASLINSATAGVSTLTSRVTHGLTLLDEAMGAPTPEDLAKNDATNENEITEIGESAPCPSNEEIQPPQVSFGFNDLLSGVSSITKLVETTSSKVISGGLETLETIGKKTMEVLQEGDPGLKKKRAFFLNESDKPILSQMLREAKENAEAEEKSLEEKQLSRKVHFESLFDDFQGLVHLEALEMLSKQCNMKIQQRLVTLDGEDELLASIQETLQEVKELCDLGDEEEEEEEEEEKENERSKDDLEQRLEAACKDLGVSITYDKLDDIWKDTRRYLADVSSEDSIAINRQVFQTAISTLARFTAFTVERFHKTAELLLIKERRSTVNEADALVHLTRILSGQIGVAANMFSNWLNERIKKHQQPDSGIDITTIFLEAANASSYIQDAFRLLIPILQVGAI